MNFLRNIDFRFTLDEIAHGNINATNLVLV